MTAEQRRPGFIATVRAEDLPRRWQGSWVDAVVLATVPLLFLVGWLVSTGSLGVWPSALVDTGLRIALMVVLVWCYRDLLARHWRRFRAAAWRSWALVLGGAVAMQLVISAIRPLIPSTTDAADTAARLDITTMNRAQVALFLLIALGPIATAVIEDTVFRHTLLLKVPVWGSRVLAALLIVANGLLFGAVHFYNFGSLIGTLPYAAVGILFNLVYLWTRNIWHVLLMHALNNAVLTVPAVLLFLIFPQA